MIRLVAKKSPNDAGRASPLDVNRAKYGLTNEVNFTMILFKNI